MKLADRLVVTTVATTAAAGLVAAAAGGGFVWLSVTRAFGLGDLAVVYERLGVAPPERAEAARALGIEPQQLIAGALRLARQDALRDYAGWALLTVLATTVLAGVVAWLIGRRLTAPLLLASERLAEGARIGLDGPDDEVRRLADAVDDAIARRDRAASAQRRFAAQAAHELRTPLATLRLEAELAAASNSSGPAATHALALAVIAAVDRETATIDALLALARAEAGALRAASVDWAMLAGGVLAETRAPGIEVQLEQGEWVTDADADLARVLVDNLVRNAARHATTKLRVVVAGSLVIENDGAPIAPAELDRLGSAFVTSGGVGLGLTIVDAIARAHGLVVRREALPGGGLRTIVREAP